MKGKEYPDTFAELEKMFKSDSDCYDYLKKLRWPGGALYARSAAAVSHGAWDMIGCCVRNADGSNLSCPAQLCIEPISLSSCGFVPCGAFAPVSPASVP